MNITSQYGFIFVLSFYVTCLQMLTSCDIKEIYEMLKFVSSIGIPPFLNVTNHFIVKFL